MLYPKKILEMRTGVHFSNLPHIMDVTANRQYAIKRQLSSSTHSTVQCCNK